MSANAIRAGRAFVELFADDSKLQRGLKRAQAKLRAFAATIRGIGLKLTAVGAAITAPLLALAKTFANVGDSLDKMAGRVGVSVEFLSALDHAAKLGGTSLEQLEGAFRGLQTQAREAANGSQSALEAFNRLGVSTTNANGQLKTTEQLFLEVAEALANVPNETERAALAFKIFGETGAYLLPILRDGSKGLKDAMEEAKRLGLVMSTEDAKSAAELTDAFTKLSSVFQQIKLAIGRALAPILTALADALKEGLPQIVEFIRSSGPLIPIALGIGAAIAVAGTALLGLSVVGGIVAGAIGAIATALSAAAGAAAFLISPFGLVLAALAGGAAAALKFTDAGKEVTSTLRSEFAGLAERATDSFGAITDALTAGDFRLAAKILWLTLKAEWMRGINVLKTEWKLWLAFFTDVFNIAGANLAKIAFKVWGGLKNIWSSVTTFLANAMTNTIAAIKIGWINFATFFQKLWVRIKSLFTSVDLAKELDRIDKAAKRKKLKVQAEAAGRVAERTAAHAQRVEQNDRMTADLNADIDRQLEARRKKTDAARREAMKLKEDPELARLREQLERAKEEARKKAEEVRNKRKEAEDNAGAGGDQLKLKTSSRGAFLSSALRGITSTSPAERTAKATEKTAEGVTKLVRKADQSKLVYA